MFPQLRKLFIIPQSSRIQNLGIFRQGKAFFFDFHVEPVLNKLKKNQNRVGPPCQPHGPSVGTQTALTSFQLWPPPLIAAPGFTTAPPSVHRLWRLYRAPPLGNDPFPPSPRSPPLCRRTIIIEPPPRSPSALPVAAPSFAPTSGVSSTPLPAPSTALPVPLVSLSLPSKPQRSLRRRALLLGRYPHGHQPSADRILPASRRCR
jgi:hypothetical protein